ncbi:hypothetical protein D9M72_453770 [compost metagenome]
MLAPPTDRLHKFLAISGVALVLVGVVYPLQQYQIAEVQRTEAVARLQAAGFAYTRFANQMNRRSDLRDQIRDKGLTGDAAKGLLDQIRTMEPEIDKLDREIQGAIIETKKQMDLEQHYRFMSNLWFALGCCCILFGAWLGTVGFRQWIQQPKTER